MRVEQERRRSPRFGPLAPAWRVGNSARPTPRMILPQGRRVYRMRGPSEPPVARRALLLPALVLGVGCGVYYFRSGDLAGAALYLGLGASVFGMLVPALAIPGAIAIALGVPAAYGAAMALGAHVPYPPAPHFAASLIALLPALTGALASVGLRRLIASMPAAHLRR